MRTYPLSATTSGGTAIPSGAAGGELAGTYPNPTIADGKIDDANIVSGGLTNAAISSSAAIAASKLGAIPESGITNLVTDLAAKAPLASPTFTGTVTLPSGITIPSSAVATTQTAQDNSTKVASTAYVDRVTVAAYAEMKMRSFLAWNAPISSGVGGAACVSQSLYVLKVPVPETISVTNIVVYIDTAGSTLTSGQNIATLYAQDGTKKGDTADQSAVWTTADVYVMAVSGGPYSITGGVGNYCWVSILSNGTTPASFRKVNASAFPMNHGGAGNLTGASMWAARNGTAVTSTSNLTLSSNSATGALGFWVGLS